MKSFLFFILIAFLTACSKSPSTLKGEVFLVDRQGESIKLADVSVKAYREDDVRKSLIASAQTIKPELEAIFPRSSECSSKSTGQPEVTHACFDGINRDLAAVIDNVTISLKPVGIERTGSTGAFSMTLPGDTTYIVVAEASREGKWGTDHYPWFTRIRLTGKEQSINLTDQTKATVATLQGMIVAAEKKPN